MLEMFSQDMNEEEVDYEAYPYKDYQGWNLSVGDIVQFAMDDRTYGRIFRVVQFTKDAQKALVASGSQTYWVTLSTLRWIR